MMTDDVSSVLLSPYTRRAPQGFLTCLSHVLVSHRGQSSYCKEASEVEEKLPTNTKLRLGRLHQTCDDKQNPLTVRGISVDHEDTFTPNVSNNLRCILSRYS